MGTITISMPNKEEELLRKIAVEKYGKTKGALSKVITEAITEMKKIELNNDERFLEIARKGLSLGKVDIKKMREEMYGRLKRF